MPKALELVGQKFGYLTVIEQMPSVKGTTMWMCRCSCGNKTVLSGGRLNFGRVKSCGCVHGMSAQEYIKSKVEINPITGCWIWQGSKRRGGYGQAKLNNEVWAAHRLSFSVFIYPIPKLKIVCHRCDVRECCNPEHLWLGTCAQNSADMVKKGRQATGDRNGARLYPEKLNRGSSNGASKLKENDIVEIRKLYNKEKLSGGIISKRFNVSESTINRILSGKTWSHV